MQRVLFFILLALLAGCTREPGFDLDQILRERPDDAQLVFDYVGLMQPVTESTARYLGGIRDQYRIEVLVVALPSLDRKYTLNEAATEIFSNWKIGRAFNSRGVLLLLVDDVKQVRLEIGYELEDVFTDLFTGCIEDKQLRPYYSAGQLDTGMIAVLEEIEARARIKFGGDYDRAAIADLDARYLSQGGGAAYDLGQTPSPAIFSGSVDPSYCAGETPQEAWETMIKRWRNRQRDPFLGVFTPVARLAYRDFTNMPDSRFDKTYRTYARKSYQVLRDADYAVIYFGKKTGWDNAPFLMCRTNEGWQFDLVHQRRYIRMGKAPHWGVEFSDHPYMGLLKDTFSYNGQDIPLEDQDRYTIYRDAGLAESILKQEALHRADPGAYEPAIELGRLYTLVAMGPKGIKLLHKAAALNPEDPRPHKYLAIAHVDAYYQYDSALAALATYIEKAPGDAFGHNFSGYIHYRKERYPQAVQAFETAVALSPDNCYAHFYLAHVYARLYEKTMAADPRRKTYLQRFNDHLNRARSFKATHPARIEILNRWAQKQD